MPASQAGRRGFDSRLPLHLFNNLPRLRNQADPIESIKPDRPLQRIDSFLTETWIRELRMISYLMHPPMLAEVGLPKTLESVVKAFAERSGIEHS